MKPLSGPKKQTQTNPISNAHKTIKGAGKKGYQELFLGLSCWKGYTIWEIPVMNGIFI